MFSFSKKTKVDKHLELLTNQTIGGQSVLYKVFKDIFEKGDDEIDKMELTYFSLTAMGFFYIRLSNYEQKEGVFDLLCTKVIEKSSGVSASSDHMDRLFEAFQSRYAGYSKTISLIFENAQKGDKSEFNTLVEDLTIDLYEAVTGEKMAQAPYLILMSISPIILQFVFDDLDLVKKELIN